ncbi:hypothetical protein KEM52_002066 [Ascosphaera acerosa]|nr:hypothetical protein KEM52_002066 [Ascosphaera acerosa]
MRNAFYVGKVDFRDEPKCTVLNYILLSFAILICMVIGAKFVAALQLGTKRRPAMQDKFVICQVPAYTEGEDQLRKGLDSLTALHYDNKRKLIWVICDGMIVGGGNDRPTPKIVLDILGVDPKIDPPALPFQSIGVGSEQLNYGKVYSGLYEYEGNVVPYIVTVKVGKESEQGKSKPGNRGKRDSQMLVMSFLNKVHFRAPMNPLELETFHQINNIIGVDPELYEYMLMVDADTSVKEDSLNRLVAACANDAKIVGICGETSLDNEGKTLPVCRDADKGKPLIISDAIIKEYADSEVDTLHKKNLLSLGEDRFLTTIMLKHFPKARFKFVQNAMALTAAPEEWRVLLSQRRRWINSTIHNLFELIWIDDLCGFCMFSMRFVVFVDLVGTIILPASVVYIIYLIIICSTTDSAIPYISIAMIAGVYGLQIVIFMLKRQWQHIGWMIIYLIAYPVYSFILPLYSFWNQDNFSWGNTRVVIGEKGDKKIVAVDDEGFDPRSIPLMRWDDYALANNLPGRRGEPEEKFNPYQHHQQPSYADEVGGPAAMEMDDMRSMYSSVKPASTILSGFPAQNIGGRASRGPAAGGPYAAPDSDSPFNGPAGHRLSGMQRYTDNPGHSQSRLSVPFYEDGPGGAAAGGQRFSPRLPSGGGANDYRHSRLSARPMSQFDLRASRLQGPDDGAIVEAIQACLADVDLDTVTKKQVRALVEQRLQTSLVGERKAFLDQHIDIELARM